MGFLIRAIRIIDSISEKIGLAVSVLMPLMVAVLAFEVVSRYIFNAPTLWAYDLSVFMFGYTGLLAGAYVLKHKEHINVDLVYSRLSPRAKAGLDCITGLLIFFFTILVIYTGWEPAMEAFRLNEATNTEWAPPVGHFRLMAPIGAALLLMQGVANWIRSLHLVITGRELAA
jgi:TRAP-type mannitol/chloroaromatic compound transport system permease small subunit